jgi:hypothetical protein
MEGSRWSGTSVINDTFPHRTLYYEIPPLRPGKAPALRDDRDAGESCAAIQVNGKNNVLSYAASIEPDMTNKTG